MRLATSSVQAIPLCAGSEQSLCSGIDHNKEMAFDSSVTQYLLNIAISWCNLKHSSMRTAPRLYVSLLARPVSIL